jgi:hypothetical protein
VLVKEHARAERPASAAPSPVSAGASRSIVEPIALDQKAPKAPAPAPQAPAAEAPTPAKVSRATSSSRQAKQQARQKQNKRVSRDAVIDPLSD